MFGTYIGNNRMLTHTSWGGKFIVSSNDFSLMPEIITKGIFDTGLTKYLINTIKPGDVIIDAGANIGYFTVLTSLLTGPSGKVIAYEASPITFSFLIDNLALNLNQNVTAFNKAVYSKNEIITFYPSERFMGNASIYKPDEIYHKYFIADRIGEEVKVEAEPLDIHINALNYINLIKVDVEGAEYQCFLGMEQMLKSNMVNQVAFELNKLRMEEDWLDFYNLLNKFRLLYGGEFYSITIQGELEYITLDALFEKEYVENVLLKFSY